MASQPFNLRFHTVPLGQSETLPATLTNTGGSVLTVSQVSNNVSAYTVNGLTVPFQLSPGQSMDFSVTFAPQKILQLNGYIAFLSNGANSPYYVNVYGRGVAGGSLAASPASLDFGTVQVGKKQSLYETLTNAGGATVTVSKADVSGAGFSVSGLSVPLVLSPSQNFTFSVEFAPQASGPATGSVAVVSDAANPNLTIPLSGTATPAGTLGVAPASLNFGVVYAGSSKSLPATLTANGAGITITSAGTDSAEFTLSGFSVPLTLPSGQSQPYTVTYTPQNNGPATATANFVSDASNSPATQSLAGSGAAPPHHSVDLSWNASPGVSGYNIYRGGKTGGPYGKINTVLEVATAFEDTQVSSGQTYFYVATAVNGDGAESTYSNEARAVIPIP